MHIGPPEFPFPSSSTTFLSHSQLMLNRFYTQMATIVHCLTQARTEKETRDKWVRGDADFTSQCASRTAGREAGALGAEFTWGGWGPGAEWETCEKKKPYSRNLSLNYTPRFPFYKQYSWDRTALSPASMIILWQAGKQGNEQDQPSRDGVL